MCTAYCACGHCCNWEHGLKLFGGNYLALHLSLIKLGVRKRKKGVREPAIIARYWTNKAPASLVGKEYLGTTSIGTYPRAVSGISLRLLGWCRQKQRSESSSSQREQSLFCWTYCCSALCLKCATGIHLKSTIGRISQPLASSEPGQFRMLRWEGTFQHGLGFCRH
jgi:hypothetical protein